MRLVELNLAALHLQQRHWHMRSLGFIFAYLPDQLAVLDLGIHAFDAASSVLLGQNRFHVEWLVIEGVIADHLKIMVDDLLHLILVVEPAFDLAFLDLSLEVCEGSYGFSRPTERPPFFNRDVSYFLRRLLLIR